MDANAGGVRVLAIAGSRIFIGTTMNCIFSLSITPSGPPFDSLTKRLIVTQVRWSILTSEYLEMGKGGHMGGWEEGALKGGWGMRASTDYTTETNGKYHRILYEPCFKCTKVSVKTCIKNCIIRGRDICHRRWSVHKSPWTVWMVYHWGQRGWCEWRMNFTKIPIEICSVFTSVCVLYITYVVLTLYHVCVLFLSLCLIGSLRWSQWFGQST